VGGLSEELAAIREIEDVLARYCYAVDDGDPLAVASVYAEDGLHDAGNGLVVRGRADIEAFFRLRLARYDASAHHLANIVVQLDGDAAHVASYVYARIWPLGSDECGELWGRYADDLVRSSEGWQITHRRLRVAGWHGFPHLPEQPDLFERLPRATAPAKS
jgi:uncharacterized protein (TIGR02246 family)